MTAEAETEPLVNDLACRGRIMKAGGQRNARGWGPSELANSIDIPPSGGLPAVGGSGVSTCAQTPTKAACAA